MTTHPDSRARVHVLRTATKIRTLLLFVLALLVAQTACERGHPNAGNSPTPPRNTGDENAAGDVAQSDATLTAESVPPIVMTLSDARVEAGELKLKLAVQNRSRDAFPWDSQNAAFLQWRIVTETGLLLEPSARSEVQITSKEAARERFVTLEPNQTLEITCNLTRGVGAFWHERAAVAGPDGSSVIVPSGGTELQSYQVPDKVVSLQIQVILDAKNEDARDGFAVYFGFRPSDLGIPRFLQNSNVVTLKF